VLALLALMLLNDARRDARIRDGQLVLLDDQDRSLWDWQQIAELYGILARQTNSAVVEMNRAIAIAELDGPAAGLAVLGQLDLDHYRYYHSTRADLLRRAGRDAEARDAYQRALELAQTEPERRFLQDRLAE
jgi:RNA polymerase sigma-70 factor (ECF subfamily)